MPLFNNIPGTPGTNGADGIGYGHPGFNSGKYYFFSPNASSSATTTVRLANDSLLYIPLFIAKNITITRLTTALFGDNFSGKLMRMGLYSNLTNGLPGNLIVDGGDIPIDTNGIKEVVINQSLTPDWYWIAINCNYTPTLLGCNAGVGSQHFLGFDAPLNSLSSYSYLQRSVAYGALPSSAPVSSLEARGITPQLWFKVA